MKLTRLEIVGFKSFAEKVTLHFSDGITSVVGPNGCGKSNIVDAIRWAMGEQSAKYLRGRAMEDVIFNGSESRGPMGMAEVTLTLKNDGVVPMEYRDYDEIAVRRRLFRDGTSEYAINKTPVRLKDITDLFLGTGAGTRAYSMIEQGRIGFIVNAKPEERRFLIEEVAGITKYKARKKTAQRRMEATEQNLLRVNDITTELERQLGSLERQAQKAERYKKVRAELRDLELHLATLRFFELRNGQVFHATTAAALQAKESDTEIALATIDARLEAERLTLSDTETHAARTAEQLHALETRFSLLERDLEFFARERDGMKDRGAQAASEAETLIAQKQTIESEIALLHDHAELLGHESESVRGDLTYKETRQKELQQRRRTLQSNAESIQREMIAALTDLAKERTQVQAQDQRRIELEARLGRAAAELADLEKQIGEHQANDELHRAEVKRLHVLDAELKTRMSGLEEQQKRTKQDLHLAEAKVLSLKEEAGGCKSRLQSLQEIANKYEGYGAGVRAVMTREGDRKAHGIFGLVADVLEAPTELETVLEAVLGERLQFVIVESQKHGLEAVEFLRAQADGRASFIPRDVAARSLSGTAPEGERLRARVRVSEGYEAVADYLLGDVVIVRELSAVTPGYCCVTTDGEVVDATGVVSGGSSSGASEGLLAQKREIKQLSEDVRRFENEILLAENEKTQTHAALLQSEESLKQTSAEWHETQIKKTKTDKDVLATGDQLRQLGRRKAQVDAERAELCTAQETIERDAVVSVERMKRTEAIHAEKEQALELLTEQDATLRDDEQQEQQALTELKVAFAQKDEKQKNVLRTLERLTQSLSETDTRIARAHLAVQTGSERAAELTGKILGGQEERTGLMETLDSSRRALQEERVAYDALVQIVRGLEEKSRSIAREMGTLRDERVQSEMRARELELERGHLERNVEDNYQLDLQSEVTDFHGRDLLDEDAPERIAQLKSQLSKMGDINLTAIDEFKEVSERHTFLSAQKADLESALSQLRSAILKINRTSRERFQQAFTATNDMFQKIFPRLFRGGEAHLELMQDSDDILEAGIDIIAQPPGKKLQSVQLLSGGEKALTAVSLIFAIFLIKPSPFCVLDEVDAPLDEGNVGRFNELLKEISKFSQFIVITHNKRTMEYAHRLYGITMDEPGISKLVSVNMQRGDAPEATV